MPVSYADVSLALPPRKLERFLGRHYPLREPRGWVGTSPHPLRPGVLRWPLTAADWACGHYLVTQQMLDAVRLAVYGPAADQYTTQTLLLDDGVTSIPLQTDLWLLPPQRIGAYDDGNPLYLLPLVDDRWHWWQHALTLSVDGTTTTWYDVYEQIGGELGVTIAVDTIPAAYLLPGARLAGTYDAVPPLLDFVASQVGQRIVRQLDGTVEALNATTSLARQAAEKAVERPRVAGNAYTFGPTP